jgi:hypothetical protein
MARGYAEGSASEERFEDFERGVAEDVPRPNERPAVYGATAAEPEQHFIGWLDEVDPDQLFDSGQAWGLKIVRRRAD